MRGAMPGPGCHSLLDCPSAPAVVLLGACLPACLPYSVLSPWTLGGVLAGCWLPRWLSLCSYNPLYIAAANGYLTVVTKLIAAGADVNKAETTDGSTPLLIAGYYGHTAIVSKLLQHGADKSIRGWQNKTPLEAAQGQNHAAIVALLA